MFDQWSFANILQAERARIVKEYNQCHVPGGSSDGGQFCSKGGGGGEGEHSDDIATGRGGRRGLADRLAGKVAGSVAKREKARRAAFDAMGKHVPGFQPKPGQVAGSTSDPDNPYSAEYQAIGVPGFKPKPGGMTATGARAQVSQDWRDAMTSAGLRTDRPGKLPKKVSHKMEYPAEGARRNPQHVATYRGMTINTLPSYTTPYYYVDAPGFGSFEQTPNIGTVKRQINAFKTTGETPTGARKRKGSERYQKRKARYGA